jgi:hypothetical protein
MEKEDESDENYDDNFEEEEADFMEENNYELN